MAQSDAVFLGRVTKIAEVERPYGDRGTFVFHEVTFQVQRLWKGAATQTFHILTLPPLSGGCGFEFEADQDYLVYASKDADGHWETNGCTRTARASEAADDLLELDGRRPKPTTPAKPPELRLRGSIPEFPESQEIEIINPLHERIFFVSSPGGALLLLQTERNSQWVDLPSYAIFDDNGKPLPEAEALARWKEQYVEMTEEYQAYLEVSARTETNFSPGKIKTRWRVGLQYLTESELDSGQRVQDSKHIVWSAPIAAPAAAAP